MSEIVNIIVDESDEFVSIEVTDSNEVVNITVCEGLQDETDPLFAAWLSATPPAYPSDIPDVSGFEEISNKTNTITESDTDYPSCNGVIDYVDSILGEIESILETI